jgi:hypothetical protein
MFTILPDVKSLTRDQLESRKAQAVRFKRDVLGDPDRADEIEAESLEDYAERRKVKLLNSFQRRNAIMAHSQTKAELQDQIEELEQANQELQDQLDAIADIVAPDDEEEDEDEDSDADDDGNDDDDDGDDGGDGDSD